MGDKKFRHDPFPGSDWREAITDANQPITDDKMPGIIENIKNQYGLNDNQIALLKPVIAQNGFRITPEVYQYINEMIAAKQEQDYNSYPNQANLMRAAGINPDLNGVGEGSAEFPSASGLPAGTNNTQESSSGGACKEKADQITKTLMQAVSLGLNAYGIVAGQIGSSIASGVTMAGEDAATILGNENGIVENIETAISNLVNSKTFRNKTERRAYIKEITRRMNAIDTVTERLNKGTQLNEAKSAFRISKLKSTDEYLQNAEDLINTKQAIDLSAARHDLIIAQRNEKFLIDHPDYTEEKLQYELTNANVREAKANAREAESKAYVAEQTQDAQIQGTKAETRSKEARADADESNKEITELRNANEKTVQNFLEDAYEAVYGTEEKELEATKGRKDLYSTRQRRRKGKKWLREYQGRKKHASVSAPGIGSVGFDW